MAEDFGLLDYGTRYQTSGVSDAEYVSWRDQQNNKTTGTTDLSFEDMLLLMVTQFQNQSIDNQADTSDMMNQLIQMTNMQAMTAMTQQMEELTTANVMSYSASLVGKEVTLGLFDSAGNIVEKVGVVEGTGTYNGSQVIFVDGESYYLSSIMGVGRLPELQKPDTGEDGEGGDKVEDTDAVEGEDKVEGGENAGDNTESTEGAENSGAAGEASGSTGSGENGNPDESGETKVAGTNGTEGI